MNAVNLLAARPCPFSTYAYLRSTLDGDEFDATGSGAEVVLLAAMEGERLVGYLPLKRTAERPLGLRGHRLGWMVVQDGDRPHLVAAPEDEARCADAFVGYLASRPREDWTALEFTGQEAGSILRAAVRRFPPRRGYVRPFPGNPTSEIAIAWRSVHEYFRELPRRRSIARSVRDVLKGRTAEWIRSTDERSGRALFEIYLALERRSWKHGTSAAIARSARRVAYYGALFADDAPMRMRVHLLTLDGAPAAAEIIGTFDGVAYGMETVYDEGLAALGPGKVAHLMLMHDCMRDGLRAYNLRWLFAYYKESLLARTIETESVQVFRRGSAYHAKAVLGEIKRRVRPVRAARLDHNPAKRASVEAAGADGAAGAAAAREALERALASGIAVDRIADGELRAILPGHR
jgi:hypothetical protein